MVYFIEWDEVALKELKKLDNSIAVRILKSISEMSLDLSKKDIKKLKGREEFRLRVGDYRVIFEIINDRIMILHVGRRESIYEK